MKTIQIKADQFFEMLKNNGVSMWDLFRNMIDGDEKQLLFLDKDEKIIAEYILPKTVEELDDDLETFKKTISSKVNLN
ncbi:MAG: hypothetical protein H3C39_02975 [Flavobacteriia bacterium]|nr:hypothetical protein [Flavobacteriia bacterium]